MLLLDLLQDSDQVGQTPERVTPQAVQASGQQRMLWAWPRGRRPSAGGKNQSWDWADLNQIGGSTSFHAKGKQPWKRLTFNLTHKSLLAQLLHSNLGCFTSNYDWHLLSPSDHQRSFIIWINQEAMSSLKGVSQKVLLRVTVHWAETERRGHKQVVLASLLTNSQLHVPYFTQMVTPRPLIISLVITPKIWQISHDHHPVIR